MGVVEWLNGTKWLEDNLMREQFSLLDHPQLGLAREEQFAAVRCGDPAIFCSPTGWTTHRLPPPKGLSEVAGPPRPLHGSGV